MLSIRSLTVNPFAENTYIINNAGGDCWIVDPGMYSPQETKVLTDIIQKEGLKPRAIINTHAHIDHILGVQQLKDSYGIPFLVHKAELPVLQRADMSAQMFGLGTFTAPSHDGFISESEPLKLGDEILEVRLAPGHSPGSIVFYYVPGGWAIGGDVLFQGSVGRTDLPGGDYPTLERSIRTQLYTLPDATIIYPGHGGPTTIGVEKKSNPFVRE